MFSITNFLNVKKSYIHPRNPVYFPSFFFDKNVKYRTIPPTYNYPQGRITDHRIGLSIYQMENFLNGDLDEMIDNLIAADRAERLKGDE